MAKQTFTTGQVLTAAQMTSLQQTALGGGSATAKTTSYVLVAADAGTVVAMNAAGSTTITVNTGLFSAGDTVFIQNWGAGTCTVTAGTATVSTHGSLALSQYEGGTLYFTSASAAIFFDISQSAGMTNPMTTAGDTIYGGASGTPTRLAIGSTGNVLTVSGGNPVWAAPAGAKVLQVVQATSTTYTTTTSASNNYVDTSLSITITPSATNSKILIACYPVLNSYNASGQSDMTTKARIVRNIPSANTVAYECTPGFFTISTGATNVDRSVAAIVPVVYLDSPSTTSATTYKLQFGQAGTARTGSYLFNNADNQTSVVIAMEIGA